MSTLDLAEVVVQARQLLRDLSDKAGSGEAATGIRQALAPLASAARELSTDAIAKLAEIEACLEELDRHKLTQKRRDELDMLMLGLWIRVEQSQSSSAPR